MYREGVGAPQDYKEALKWYRQAAEQGHAVAQSNLGAMYGKGQGAAQDFILAHMWSSLAMSQGLEGAMENRDLVEKIMSPDDIAKALNLAREWMINRDE